MTEREDLTGLDGQAACGEPTGHDEPVACGEPTELDGLAACGEPTDHRLSVSGVPAATVSEASHRGASSSGMLSLVGTPIGNLSDASPRVLETLRRADVLLCEDTRVTSKLLARFDIRVPLERCDENVIASRVDDVVDRVAAGSRVAFVSDAGMPGVSDPGQRLVDAALDADLPVEVIPGPSAVTCALVASGLGMDHFFFEGFLPRKAGEKARRLAQLAAVPGALVMYESPHRVADTLDAIVEAFPARRVALVRELTKLHEECVRDVSGALAARIRERGDVRGECVIVVEGPSAEELDALELAAAGLGAGTPVQQSVEDAIREGLAGGTPKSALAKRIARQFNLPRAEAYDRVVEIARA